MSSCTWYVQMIPQIQSLHSIKSLPHSALCLSRAPRLPLGPCAKESSQLLTYQLPCSLVSVSWEHAHWGDWDGETISEVMSWSHFYGATWGVLGAWVSWLWWKKMSECYLLSFLPAQTPECYLSVWNSATHLSEIKPFFPHSHVDQGHGKPITNGNVLYPQV